MTLFIIQYVAKFPVLYKRITKCTFKIHFMIIWYLYFKQVHVVNVIVNINGISNSQRDSGASTEIKTIVKVQVIMRIRPSTVA
jgi:hypothetical protein